MAITEKIQKKLEGMKEKMAEKSAAASAENSGGAEIDTGEWILLFLAAGFVEIIVILFTIIGIIPIVGQVAYPFLVGTLNAIVSGIFFLYLRSKGLTQYWGLAFGGGVANLIPVLNWFGWIGCVLVLYFLVKAEKVPLAGETIAKAAKVASKIK